MVLLMFGILNTDLGFFSMLMERKYLWAVVILGLSLSMYLLLSYYAIIWIERHFSSFLEPDMRYLVFPLLFPMILVIVIGFVAQHYLAFAYASLTGLWIARSYLWLQKKRSTMDMHRLRYQLLVRYAIGLTILSFIIYVSLSF